MSNATAITQNAAVVRSFISLVVTLIIMGVLLFAQAGTLDWPLGWWFGERRHQNRKLMKAPLGYSIHSRREILQFVGTIQSKSSRSRKCSLPTSMVCAVVAACLQDRR